MATLEDLIEMGTSMVQREPEVDIEEQEEYLDRIGVEDDSDGDTEDGTLHRAREVAQRMDQVRTPTALNTTDVMRAHDNMYGHPYEGTAYGSVLPQMQEFHQEYMEWSNGDHEPRPRRDTRWRNNRNGHERYRQYRNRTGGVVHDAIQRGQQRVLDTIIQDCDYLIHELLHDPDNRLPDNEYERNMIVEAMIDHYLEDMGDNMFIRHKVRVTNSPHSFDNTCVIQVEMPGGIVREMQLMLNMYGR